MLTANIVFGQIYVDYDDINQNDIIDALSFAGIGLFKFDIDSLEGNHNFYLVLEEYAGKDNLISTDTLLGQSPFELRGNGIKSIRFLTKVENNSFEKVYLYITTQSLSAIKKIEMDKKYIRKHYWLEFEKTNANLNHKVPLLFLGSEWDSEFNGEKTTRFCSFDKVPVDLSGDALKEIPHFYIISYLLK